VIQIEVVAQPSMIQYMLLHFFFGFSIIYLKAKKQSMARRFSAETKYKAMTNATCEVT